MSARNPKLRSLVQQDRRPPRLNREERQRAVKITRARQMRRNGLTAGDGGSLRRWEGEDREMARTHARAAGVAVTTRDAADRYLVHCYELPTTKAGALATFTAAAELHAAAVRREGGLHGRIEVEVVERCDVWAPVHTKPGADGGDGGREPLWSMSLNS